MDKLSIAENTNGSNIGPSTELTPELVMSVLKVLSETDDYLPLDLDVFEATGGRDLIAASLMREITSLDFVDVGDIVSWAVATVRSVIPFDDGIPKFPVARACARVRGYIAAIADECFDFNEERCDENDRISLQEEVAHLGSHHDDSVMQSYVVIFDAALWMSWYRDNPQDGGRVAMKEPAGLAAEMAAKLMRIACGAGDEAGDAFIAALRDFAAAARVAADNGHAKLVKAVPAAKPRPSSSAAKRKRARRAA